MSNFIPIKNIFIPNNKITKVIFGFNQNQYNANIGAKRFSILGKIVDLPSEDDKKRETKKHQIKYFCRLRIIEDPLIQLTDAEREYLSTPLNLFDRLIFTALVSARVEGISEISISALYRIITGKASNNCKPSKNHAAEILKSVKKLACLQVELDMSDAFQNYRERNGAPKYNFGKPLIINFTPIIPCRIFDGIFQGNSATVIQLTANSPLYKVAHLTKQILTVPREVLNIGNMRNTSAVAYGVKLYSLIRVLEIRGSGYLKESITFADILEKCGIKTASGNVQTTVRDIISAILLNLQALVILKSFEIVRENNTFVKVNLVYLPPTKIRKIGSRREA